MTPRPVSAAWLGAGGLGPQRRGQRLQRHRAAEDAARRHDDGRRPLRRTLGALRPAARGRHVGLKVGDPWGAGVVAGVGYGWLVVRLVVS